MRSLRARVLLVVALGALGPLLSMGFWIRRAIKAEAASAAATVRSRTLREQRDAFERAMTARGDAVAALCQIGQQLIAESGPATGIERPPTTWRPASARILESWRQRARLDGLMLADAQHRALLLATPAVPEGELGKWISRSVNAEGRMFLLPGGAGGPSQDTLVWPCTASSANLPALWIGYRSLAALLADELLATSLVEVSLENAESAPNQSENAVFTFQDASGTPLRRLVAKATAGSVGTTLRTFDEGLLVSAGLALLFALLVGGSLAWAVTRPLRDLEAAAARVGSGDLDSTLGVQSDNELGRALRAFNRMTVDLKSSREKLRQAERLGAWQDIARRIAHEIKNPLSPIQISIETMRKTHASRHPEFDVIFEESTRVILDEVHKLDRLVTEFSDFARMPAPKMASVDVAALVHHAEALWRNEENLAFELKVEGDVGTLQADRDQLSDVLNNLLKNATEAATSTKRAPVVRLSVRRNSSGVVIGVHDSGPGVPHDERARIMEPYVTTKTHGTGLGLSIVQRIVNEHGGTLTVRDSPLGGALFELFLPSARG